MGPYIDNIEDYNSRTNDFKEVGKKLNMRNHTESNPTKIMEGRFNRSKELGSPRNTIEG